jgi:Predicted hydrolases or acyltransferases (alpha/beta hydrolase superfamily)
MATAISPFLPDVSDDILRDLNARLARTRYPDQLEGAGWDYGTELGYLREFCDYWRTCYDWRSAESRFNAFPQFVTEAQGERLHFYHVRSPEPNAVPLIITHGWPGSIAEFLEIIGPLSDPVAHGGNCQDAFHVIMPSIPGYGWSGPTRHAGFDCRRAAKANIELMHRLGYSGYIAQGGDWGAAISSWMAILDEANMRALHINLISGSPADPDNPLDGLSQQEINDVEWKREYDVSETAYQIIQGTKPQSLAYGLNDSPSGLAAWILEKFRRWSDCDGDIERTFTKDRLLDNVMLYWVTGTINSANRMYYESMGPGRYTPLPRRVEVPTGHARYPGEIRRTPRAWAERDYNIVDWQVMPRGGHFAAMEQPLAYVDEVRRFARAFRAA